MDASSNLASGSLRRSCSDVQSHRPKFPLHGRRSVSIHFPPCPPSGAHGGGEGHKQSQQRKRLDASVRASPRHCSESSAGVCGQHLQLVFSGVVGGVRDIIFAYMIAGSPASRRIRRNRDGHSGILQLNCDPVAVARKAAQDSAMLCRAHLGQAPCRSARRVAASMQAEQSQDCRGQFRARPHTDET